LRFVVLCLVQRMNGNVYHTVDVHRIRAVVLVLQKSTFLFVLVLGFLQGVRGEFTDSDRLVWASVVREAFPKLTGL
jgi:hypothetical protein